MEKRQQRAWGNQEQEWTGAWWEEKSLKPNPITWLKQCNVKRARGEFCMMSISTEHVHFHRSQGCRNRMQTEASLLPNHLWMLYSSSLKTTWFIDLKHLEVGARVSQSDLLPLSWAISMKHDVASSYNRSEWVFFLQSLKWVEQDAQG